jgi:hypothetical protein
VANQRIIRIMHGGATLLTSCPRSERQKRGWDPIIPVEDALSVT